MRAITTKYYGPTNHRGSKIKATAFNKAGGYLYQEYDDALNLDKNHLEAAKALVKRLMWKGTYVVGYKDSGEFIWVNIDEKDVERRFTV